ESRRIGLVSVSSCCFRALSTVSATGFACNEATSAFTARCNLVSCAYSFLSMLSEGFIVSLSLHDASHATRLESVSLGRTLTDWLMCPWLDTPICQRCLYTSATVAAAKVRWLVTNTSTRSCSSKAVGNVEGEGTRLKLKSRTYKRTAHLSPLFSLRCLYYRRQYSHPDRKSTRLNSSP